MCSALHPNPAFAPRASVWAVPCTQHPADTHSAAVYAPTAPPTASAPLPAAACPGQSTTPAYPSICHCLHIRCTSHLAQIQHRRPPDHCCLQHLQGGPHGSWASAAQWQAWQGCTCEEDSTALGRQQLTVVGVRAGNGRAMDEGEICCCMHRCLPLIAALLQRLLHRGNSQQSSGPSVHAVTQA